MHPDHRTCRFPAGPLAPLCQLFLHPPEQAPSPIQPRLRLSVPGDDEPDTQFIQQQKNVIKDNAQNHKPHFCSRFVPDLNVSMRPIQFVDLKRQYTKIKSEVDPAIQEVLDSTVFINGKAVTDLAAGLSSYTGSRHVIPCANGTDALQIALMALDLQPGDEVITPSFTFIATTEVVALLQLKPVFVEVDPKTF